MTELTTLQLARAVADAVLRSQVEVDWDRRHTGQLADHDDPMTQAVLATLRAHDSWFCRAVPIEGFAGYTTQVAYPPVQLNLLTETEGG